MIIKINNNHFKTVKFFMASFFFSWILSHKFLRSTIDQCKVSPTVDQLIKEGLIIYREDKEEKELSVNISSFFYNPPSFFIVTFIHWISESESTSLFVLFFFNSFPPGFTNFRPFYPCMFKVKFSNSVFNGYFIFVILRRQPL